MTGGRIVATGEPAEILRHHVRRHPGRCSMKRSRSSRSSRRRWRLRRCRSRPASAGRTPDAAAADDSRRSAATAPAASATPVKIEIYEPTIPIPAVPQAEFDLGYTKVKADSAARKGRASWLWPGDAVGEGLKTFFDQLGLPPQLGENGYPVQVNSQYPSGEAQAGQRAVPRHRDDARRAGEGKTVAPGRLLPRLRRRRRRRRRAGRQGRRRRYARRSRAAGRPGLPSTTSPTSSALARRSPRLGRRSPAATREPPRADGDAADDSADAGATPTPASSRRAVARSSTSTGYVADSQSASRRHAGHHDLAVRARRRPAARRPGHPVRHHARPSSRTSDGTTGTSPAAGPTRHDDHRRPGPSRFGPEGFVAAGQPGAIPGLPDDPTAALAAARHHAAAAQADVQGRRRQGLRHRRGADRHDRHSRRSTPVLDAAPARHDPRPGPVPARGRRSSRACSGAIGNLSPKIVVTLGYATTAVDTVQGIADPDRPCPTTTRPASRRTSRRRRRRPAATGGGAAGGGAGLGGGTAPRRAGAATPAADAATARSPTPALAGSGLPPLFSIPGAAALRRHRAARCSAGSYLRKARRPRPRRRRLLLRTASTSGLPDLRKVQ